jgi:hypothetical protein
MNGCCHGEEWQGAWHVCREGSGTWRCGGAAHQPLVSIFGSPPRTGRPSASKTPIRPSHVLPLCLASGCVILVLNLPQQCTEVAAGCAGHWNVVCVWCGTPGACCRLAVCPMMLALTTGRATPSYSSPCRLTKPLLMGPIPTTPPQPAIPHPLLPSPLKAVGREGGRGRPWDHTSVMRAEGNARVLCLCCIQRQCCCQTVWPAVSAH